jgi:hypothetical protein
MWVGGMSAATARATMAPSSRNTVFSILFGDETGGIDDND